MIQKEKGVTKNKQAVSSLAVSFRRNLLRSLFFSKSAPYVPPAGVAPKKERSSSQNFSVQNTKSLRKTLSGFFLCPKLCCRPFVGSLAAGRELYRSEFPCTTLKTFSLQRWESFLVTLHKKGNSLSSHVSQEQDI